MRNAIDRHDTQALANAVLTVGVVSNHGNWFTADTENKEMRVLAQSYDWLVFLTDPGLSEFITALLQSDGPDLAATREAFTASFGRSGGATRFTKVTIDAAADAELSTYFASTQPWDRWFNVITPRAGIGELREDLTRLRVIHR